MELMKRQKKSMTKKILRMWSWIIIFPFNRDDFLMFNASKRGTNHLTIQKLRQSFFNYPPSLNKFPPLFVGKHKFTYSSEKRFTKIKNFIWRILSSLLVTQSEFILLYHREFSDKKFISCFLVKLFCVCVSNGMMESFFFS